MSGARPHQLAQLRKLNIVAAFNGVGLRLNLDAIEVEGLCAGNCLRPALHRQGGRSGKGRTEQNTSRHQGQILFSVHDRSSFVMCGSLQAHNIEEEERSRAEPLKADGEKNAAKSSRLHSGCLDAPAVGALVHHAGVEHDAVFAGGRHGAAVCLADLAHRGHLIGAGAQLGGQGDLVAQLQGVDLPEMVVDAPVVARQGDGSVPDAGVREVAGSLDQGPAAGTLIDL